MSSAISCLDTRYFNDVKELINVIDEFAYYRNRIYVELKYFELFTSSRITYDPYKDFTYNDYTKIVESEAILKHDVKAIEYFIKALPEVKETHKSHLIHIGLTSQDVNSLGFMICFRDSLFIILNNLNNLITLFTEQLITPYLDNDTSINTKDILMLGFTHGQPATPTHFSKEMLIYKTRLDTIYNEIKEFISSGLTVKFGGATGEMNALKFSLPDTNWKEWADHFILQLVSGDAQFIRSPYTNQCDNYDSVIKVLYMIKRMLHILEHVRGNLWLYIHRDYLLQKTIKTEIGSSTMPNKTNPIDLENAKTSIELAKRMIDGICDILTETSYQRDISDSSALRNIASLFGYVLISLKKITSGVSRLSPNKKRITEELNDHPEVVLEGIQTYLKIHCNIENAYEIMKTFSRGNKITLLDIYCMIDELDIDEIHKIILKNLTPETYK
jgi:adenylosuccinate lyase